jgi:hypothetical protein
LLLIKEKYSGQGTVNYIGIEKNIFMVIGIKSFKGELEE